MELKKAGVKFYKTPDAILRAQLAAWDKTMAKKAGENPLFKKVLDSQKAFAERAGQWQNDYMRRLQDGLQPLLRRARRRSPEIQARRQPAGTGRPLFLTLQASFMQPLLKAADRF